MQTVFRQAMIAGNPVHPFSSVQACNQTAPIEMGRQPCGDILHSSPFRENVEISALTDELDQIQHHLRMTYFRILQIRNQMQVLLNPWHSLSGNDALCGAAVQPSALPAGDVDYVVLSESYLDKFSSLLSLHPGLA